MIKFIEHVRQEFYRVVWPTRSEVKVTTIIVLCVAFIMSVFFVVVDRLILLFLRLLSF